MKRIIPVILVFVFLAGTGISNANTAVYIRETHLGAKNFFSPASAGSTPGEIRNNHTLKSHKRTVASSVTVDQNGNTTQKGTQKFYYDYQNRVVRTADSQGTTTSEIKYDALGRRTQKVIGTDTLNYYYDGDMVIEERDGSDQVLRQYVNGNQIDELCAIANYVNGVYANTYYVHTDGIGSTTAVTDQAGNIVERVSYDVYGQPTFTDGTGTVIPGSTIGNTVLFQGRRYDTETNLYYFRARHYDPTMGRFLQTDPMGYKDSMNLYQAFNMNGVNYTDPMGLMWTNDNYEYNRIKRAQEAESKSPILRGVNAGLRTVTVGAMFIVIAAESVPVAVASGAYLMLNGVGDSLNARLDAGQSMEEAKRGTIVDMTTLGGYKVFTGRDAGSGDAVIVDSEDYGNFVGNVAVLVGGPKLYKAAKTAFTEPKLIRINLHPEKCKYNGGGFKAPAYNPTQFGLSSIADNSQLNAIWERAIQEVSQSSKGNAFTRMIDNYNSNRVATSAELSEAFQCVSKKFYSLIKKAKIQLPDNSRLHHWNFNKSTYTNQVFDSRNIFATTPDMHETIHRITSSDSNIWKGPVRENCIIIIEEN